MFSLDETQVQRKPKPSEGCDVYHDPLDAPDSVMYSSVGNVYAAVATSICINCGALMIKLQRLTNN